PGRCQPLRRTGAVRMLPPDAEVAVSIGLVRDSAAIGGPNREAISATKGEATETAGCGEIENPHRCFLAIVSRERDLRSVWGYAWEVVVVRRNLDPFD